MFIATDIIMQYNVGDTLYTLAKFEVDTASNLPTSTNDSKISIGSEAHVIDTNSKYCMGANDTWVLQEAGTASYTKAEVDAIIQSLDATSVGGSGKYISSIYETDGIIYATPSTIQTSVNTSTNAVSSNAVKTYVDNSATTLSNSIAPAVFGMGQNTYIPEDTTGINLDSYTTAGIYIKQYAANVDTFVHTPFQEANSNYGFTSAAFKLIVEYYNSSNNIRQTLIPLYENTGYFVRTRMTGAGGQWKAWVYYSGSYPFSSGQAITTSQDYPLDLDDLKTPGRYSWGTTAVQYISSLPSDFPSGGSGFIKVEGIFSDNRFRQTIYANSKTNAGKFWQRNFASEGWSPWYRFDGTQVSTLNNLQSLGGDMRSSLNEEQEEIIDDER